MITTTLFSSDIAEEQKHLTELYKDVTDCIPVLLEDQEGLPVGEIYAPLLIEEDLDAMKRTRRPDEPSGSRSLDSVQSLFYVRDRDGGKKLSTRILIKGEAGSGKSVLCLKLVESWCQLKQSQKYKHVCEKHSELVVQLEKDHKLPQLLDQLCSGTPRRMPEIPCTTCEIKQCLSQFDLLYYIPLRDATEGKTSVLDLLCDAVCKKRQNIIARTKRLLNRDDIRCLILLDGVDEWPNPHGFTELPNSDGLSLKCVLLWTMRPWKLVHLHLKPKHDDHIVTVCGLSSYSVAKVIENILTRFYGLSGEVLKSRFLAYCKKVTDKTLAGIMRMPMMLIAACHLFHREKAVGFNKSLVSEQFFSKTHLYLSLLDIMIQNAVRKRSKQGSTEHNPTAALLSDRENNPPTHRGLPRILKTFHHHDYVSNFIDLLLPFCELAFTDLMSAETKLVFITGQLERQLGKSHVDLANRLGLISQAKVRSNIGSPQNVSVSFYHKSVQELLAAIYMTCGDQETITTFFDYCSTLEKIMETADITMFVVGIDPSLGCRICEHITNIVNSDPDITEYRQTFDNNPDIKEYRRILDTSSDRVSQLYRTQCEWYRELTHSRAVTDDTSPPPSLLVTDIYLWDSDSDTMRLTEELMCSNRDTIVSVTLWLVDRPLHSVIESLPDCPHLTALNINYVPTKESRDLLVSVIPRLTQLTTVRYSGVFSSDAAKRAAVATIMSLAQLVRIQLEWVSLDDYCLDDDSDDDDGVTCLGDDGLDVTDMIQLQTVVLNCVCMSVERWGRFVSSLLTLPQSVCVRLHGTNIDDGTVRRIQTSPRFNVTRDDERNGYLYERLDFTTVPSQTGSEVSNVDDRLVRRRI